MSYQLRQSQTLGDNLRRICRKQIEGAIAIAKGEKESRDTPRSRNAQTVEENPRGAAPRTKGKSDAAYSGNRIIGLRDVARLISDVRDAEVRLQTVRQFGEARKVTEISRIARLRRR